MHIWCMMLPSIISFWYYTPLIMTGIFPDSPPQCSLLSHKVDLVQDETTQCPLAALLPFQNHPQLQWWQKVTLKIPISICRYNHQVPASADYSYQAGAEVRVTLNWFIIINDSLSCYKNEMVFSSFCKLFFSELENSTSKIKIFFSVKTFNFYFIGFINAPLLHFRTSSNLIASHEFLIETQIRSNFSISYSALRL